MNDKLYTQCPSCETTFALTPAQLEAREGLVRCGFCSAVFRADQYLRPPPGSREGRARNGDLATAPGPHRREPEQNQGRETAPESIADISLERDSTPQPDEFVTTALAKALTGGRSRRRRTMLWFLGVVLLLALLGGQVVFFYATELSRFQQFRPWVIWACERLGCEIRPRQNVGLIDILGTNVARHPTQARALRIRTSLVNRADFTQPYPRMEVTLTNQTGAVVGRRTYSAREYLKTPGAVARGMAPHVVLEGLLDIKNPDPRPGGYEIRLLPG